MICDDARSALLGGEAVAQFDAHLAGCTDCRAVLPELERLRRSLADPALWEESSRTADDLVAAIGHRRHLQSMPGRRRRWPIGVAPVHVFAVGVSALAIVRHHPADWTVPLVGAESALGATGSVAGWNVDGGNRLVLETSGLAAAPPGEVYELWFMSGDEAFSAGTFTDPGKVQLMVGVARREYPNVLVTLESADGDPAPSATWVLWSTWDEEGR